MHEKIEAALVMQSCNSRCEGKACRIAAPRVGFIAKKLASHHEDDSANLSVKVIPCPFMAHYVYD
jgi:hypothetical protein